MNVYSVILFSLMWSTVISLEIVLLPDRIRFMRQGGHWYVFPYTDTGGDLHVPGWVFHLSYALTLLFGAAWFVVFLQYWSGAFPSISELILHSLTMTVIQGICLGWWILFPWLIINILDENRDSSRYDSSFSRFVSGIRPLVPHYTVALMNSLLFILAIS
ncbi:hypothetical protein COO72_10880 [Bifidobacterium callitrichos]|nr:hypothetical protein COO72_10880 [Bifidobacterium callitrichos]